MVKINITPQEMSKILKNKNTANQKNVNQGEKVYMKNKLIDLNNHLFAQLERLGDEDLQGEELEREINRAKAITDVSTQIINNGNLTLKTAQFLNEAGYGLNGTIEQNIMGFIGNNPSEDKLLGNSKNG